MPGVIGGMIERPKMTRSMYQALKRHILAEREKKKQGKIPTVTALIKRQKETVVFLQGQVLLQLHCETFSYE